MNIILNDEQREAYKSSINELIRLCPETISRKIARANIQQAFVFYHVKKSVTSPAKLLSIGSYEDTACEALIKSGYDVFAIDPVINFSLDAFYKQTEKKFDVIFSTSVIEHVEDDELFIDQICKLLNPSGIAILTCDFNNDYKSGDHKPSEDYRLYTKNDLLVRFNNILKRNNCSMIGNVDYDHEPDFQYAGCTYTFATYMFRKTK